MAKKKWNELFQDVKSQPAQDSQKGGNTPAFDAPLAGRFQGITPLLDDNTLQSFAPIRTVVPTSPVTKNLLGLGPSRSSPLVAPVVKQAPLNSASPPIVQPNSQQSYQQSLNLLDSMSKSGKSAHEIFDAADKAYKDYMASDEKRDFYLKNTSMDAAGHTVTKQDEKEAALRAARDHWKNQVKFEQNTEVASADRKKIDALDDEGKRLLNLIAYDDGTLSQDKLVAERQKAYQTLYKNYGLDGKTVTELLETMKWDQNAKDMTALQTETAQNATKNFGSKATHSAGSIGANLIGNVTAIGGVRDELQTRTGRYATLDPNNPGYAPQVYAQTARGAVAETIDNGFLRDLYTGGMSAGDNLARMAVGLMSGGSATTLLLAGTGSAGSTVREATMSGATPTEATLLGVIDGATEILTEKIPLDNLMEQLEVASTVGKEPFLKAAQRIAGSALKQVGSEVTEEEVGLLTGMLAEYMIRRGNADYNQTINDLVVQGVPYAEAKKQADDAVWHQIGQTAYETTISTLMQTGGTEVIGKATGKINETVDGLRAIQQDNKALDNWLENLGNQEKSQNAQKAPIAPDPVTATQTQEKPLQTVDAPVRADVQETQTETQDIAPLPETKNAPAQDVTEAKAGQEIEDTGIELEKDFKDYPYDKQKVIKGYEDSTDQNILDFLDKYEQGKTWKGEKIKIGTVSDRMASEIQRITGVTDKAGNPVLFNTNAIEHIREGHGIDGSSDHTMANAEDIARINYVLQNFDHCDMGDSLSHEFKNRDNTPGQKVVFSKKINGTFYVVEAVPDTTKTWIVTAYMNKNGPVKTNEAPVVTEASNETQGPNEGTYVPNDQTVHGQESLTGDVQNEHTYSSTDSVDDIAPVVKQDKVETSTENDIAPIGENAEKNDSPKPVVATKPVRVDASDFDDSGISYTGNQEADSEVHKAKAEVDTLLSRGASAEDIADAKKKWVDAKEKIANELGISSPDIGITEDVQDIAPIRDDPNISEHIGSIVSDIYEQDSKAEDTKNRTVFKSNGYVISRTLSRDGEHYSYIILSPDGAMRRGMTPVDNNLFYADVADGLEKIMNRNLNAKDSPPAIAPVTNRVSIENEGKVQDVVSRTLASLKKQLSNLKGYELRSRLSTGEYTVMRRLTKDGESFDTSIYLPDGSELRMKLPTENKAFLDAVRSQVEYFERSKYPVAPTPVRAIESDGPVRVEITDKGDVLRKDRVSEAEEKKSEPRLRSNWVMNDEQYQEFQERQAEKRIALTKETGQAPPKKPAPKNLRERIHNGWTMFKEGIFDKGATIEDLGLKHRSPELDAQYRSIQRSGSRADALIYHGNERNGVRALNDIYGDVQESGLLAEFQEYLVHYRNIDATTLEERLGKPNKGILGDTTTQMSKDVVERYESKHPEFVGLAQDLYRYNDELTLRMVESGQISAELNDLLHEMYPHYIPIKRAYLDSGNIEEVERSATTGVNRPLRSAEGGAKKIVPLFDTLANRTYAVEQAYSMNKFGQELYNTLYPGYAQQLQSPAQSMFGTTMDFNESSLLDDMTPGNDFVSSGPEANNPTFSMYVNGEKHIFEITPEAYLALKPKNDILSKEIPGLSFLSDLRRRSITSWNPAFNMMRNPVKDIQEVLKNSKHPLATYANMTLAYSELLTKGDWYQEYRNAGGADIGNFIKSDQTDYFNREKGVLDRIETMHGMKQMKYVGELIEQAPRLAEYIASREKGASIEQAMLDSARVTVDFGAGGEVTKFVDRNGATFLNASVQGAWQHVRNVREANAAGLKGWIGLVARYSVTPTAAVILNNLIWGDDDDYENLSDYVKERYYIGPKLSDGRFIRIPKGRTDATIINAIQQVQKSLSGDDEADWNKFFKIFMENMAPNNPLTDNIFAPFVQAKTNKAWYGDKIVNERLEKLPGHEQYDEKTDDFSIALAEYLYDKWGVEVSPKRVNYLIDNTTGVIGDTFLPMITAKATTPKDYFGAKVLAPYRDVFTVDPIFNDKSQNEFFDKLTEVEDKAASENATAEDKLRSSYMVDYNVKLSKLYAEQREVQMDKSMKNSEKYTKAKEVRKKINALQKEALDGLKKKPSIDGKYAEFGGKRFDYNEQAGRWYTSEESADSAKNSYYEKEQAITKGYGISYSEYWNNKDKYDAIWYFAGQYREDERHIPVTTASTLFGMDNFARYAEAINKIPTGDDGKKWKTVQTYVDGLNLEPMEKQILMRIYYGDGERERTDWQKRKYSNESYDIVKWLDNNPSISDDEFWKIVDELGFYVDDNGKITW